ncbi:MAG: DUF4294 domain-containing protein [Bacteroidales bacterium]|nr:DUF4294 domain-containing protein [Bacteroidales bacterium]
MNKQIFILFFLLLIQELIQAQIPIQPDSARKFDDYEGYLVYGDVIDGDTVIHVGLRQIIIRPPFRFKSRKQYRRYSRLVRYVKKVYPYSLIVSEQLSDIHSHLDEYKTEKEKKAYLKKKEQELKDEFEGKLRKLTYTQGRILVKLINRETGYTTYAIVKELKGSLNAFFWQSVARLFGNNLKMEYDPKGDDKMIEDIVIRIENGEL